MKVEHLTSLFGKLRGGIAEVKAEIHGIDRKLGAAAEERDRLLYAKVGAGELLHFVEADLDSLATAFVDGLIRQIEKAPPTYRELIHRQQRGMGAGVPLFSGSGPAPLAAGALALYLKGPIMAQLTASLGRAKLPASEMTLEERGRKIAELERQMTELEQQRAELVERLHALWVTK